jgi:hypothetical protein
LSHLINIHRMPQICTASSYETRGGYADRIWGKSDLYRVRSRGGYSTMGAIRMDMAAGAKNIAGGDLSKRFVNGMIGRGRGRVWVPVEVIVSALDTQVMRLDVLMNWTY